MSAHLSFAGSTMADSWPMAHVMAGMSAVPVGHAIDLAFFFPVGQSSHDSLIAETRRHLGGCLTAIETALRVRLDRSPDVSEALVDAPEPLCWSMICAQPTLLGPALLAHMQLRASVSLMLRQFGQMDAELDDPAEDEEEVEGMRFGDALAALALSEGRWIARGGEDRPMRPDLPSDFFAELVWTAAACLAAAARRAAPERVNPLLTAFEQAAESLLADHDERVSPLIAAEELVEQMGDLADAPDLLVAALSGRRFLLFAALAARRQRLTIFQVIHILTMAPLPQLAALCRALGGSDADYRHLLLALRPVRPWLTDNVVITEAERYQDVGQEAANAAMSALRMPDSFRAKLDHLMGLIAA